MIKWVVRFAFITGLLGLAGTIVIIYSLHRRHEDKNMLKEENRKELPVKNSTIDSTLVSPPLKHDDTLFKAKPVVAEKSEDTPAAMLPAPAKIEKQVSKPVPVRKEGNEPEAKLEDAKKLKKQNQPVQKAGEKILTKKELQHLVNRILIQKTVNNLYSNCVQLYSTTDGNKKRTVSQIENYLKNHHFVIAGREVISKKVKGIQISPNGRCIRITIGTF